MNFTEDCYHNLFLLIEAYGEATGQSETTLSAKLYGNGTFFRLLRAKKRTVSIDKLGAMLVELVDNWPDDAPWPRGLIPMPWTQESLRHKRR